MAIEAIIEKAQLSAAENPMNIWWADMETHIKCEQIQGPRNVNVKDNDVMNLRTKRSVSYANHRDLSRQFSSWPLSWKGVALVWLYRNHSTSHLESARGKTECVEVPPEGRRTNRPHESWSEASDFICWYTLTPRSLSFAFALVPSLPRSTTG